MAKRYNADISPVSVLELLRLWNTNRTKYLMGENQNNPMGLPIEFW
jgi:hypothetical protein